MVQRHGGGQGVPPIETVQPDIGGIGNAGEGVADRLAAHHLLGTCLRDGHAGGQALVRHLEADDLPLMLQVGGEFRLIDAVVVWGLDLPDSVAGQGKLFGNRTAPAVAPNGVHYISGLVINLEHGPLQERACGQTVGRVVVGGFLDDLDLSRDGDVLPGDLGGPAALDVDCFQLCVRHIPLVLQFSQVVAAALCEVVDVDISSVVAGVLADGVFAAVIEQEGHTGDSAAIRVHLMDVDAGERLVGHGLAGGLSILDGKIDGRIVQLESIRSLGLHGIVVAALQGQVRPAVLPGGHGVHQDIIRYPTNLEGGIGDALCFVRLVDLGEFHAAHRRIVKIEFLRIIRVNYHGLTLCVRVDSISGDALHFGHDHCAGDAGEDDLTLRIGPVQAVGGQLSAFVWEVGAVRIGDLELHPLQRGLVLTGQLVDDEISHRLVAELHGDGLALLDLNSLRCIVQQIAVLSADLLDDQRGPRLHPFH